MVVRVTDCICVVRQSQGSEDSVSLEQQRETTQDLAADLGDDDPEMLDLGVHTGFSRFVKAEEEQSLDANPGIQNLQTGLQNGEWDYLVAYDDTRLARDQFYWVLAHDAARGDVEFRFVKEVPDDRLTFAVQRVVESEVKRKEMQKVRDAKRRRREQGMHDGKAPFGLRYDDASEYLERDPGEWDQLVTIFEMVDDADYSYADIVDEVDGITTRGAITKIKKRRERYEEYGLASELAQ